MSFFNINIKDDFYMKSEVDGIFDKLLIQNISSEFHSFLNTNYSTTNYATKGYTYLTETTLNSNLEAMFNEFFEDEYTGELFEGLHFKVGSDFASDWIMGVVNYINDVNGNVQVSIYYNPEIIKVIGTDMSS